MRFRKQPVFWLILFLPCLLLCNKARAADATSYHSAKTDAEKILSHIISLDDSDENLFEFVLHRPWYNSSKDTGYADLFTQSYLNFWSGLEATLVKDDCNCFYRGGEICGIDWSPITCGQDGAVFPLLFLTISSDEKRALISACSTKIQGCATYSLIMTDNKWKLDATSCPVPSLPK